MKNQPHFEVFSGQSGFTLIELLIAIAIFTIGILSVNAMQIAAIGGNSTANRITESTSWTCDRMESLIGLDYDDSDLKDNTDDGDSGLDDTGDDADGKLTSPDGNYKIYWNISEDYPFPGVKTINVITISQEKGITKSVSITYMKADSI